MSSATIRAAIKKTLLWVASGAGSVAAVAGAQEAPPPDTSQWKCEQCPFGRSYVAEYELGAEYVSDDSAPLGSGTGHDEKGTEVLAAGSGAFASDAYRMRWDLEDLGLDSRSATIHGGSPGIYMYRVVYEELPYRRFNDTETVFRRTADDALGLPAGWVPAGTTDGFTALDASLVDRDIESDRRSYEVGGSFSRVEHLKLSASYRRTDRDGWGIAGASFFNNSALLPVPFDESTDSIEFAADYSRDRWFAQLAWFASNYDNSNRRLLWDNPYLAGSQGELAQAPDNDAQTISLSGAYYFPARTVLSLSAAIGEIKQDEPLLAYTINPAITASPLPRQSFDGKIDTTNIDVRITSQPWSPLRLQATYRYDDRDNRSPVLTWSGVITDLFPSGELEENRPYSFRRSRFGVAAFARIDHYSWLKPFEFGGGYDRTQIDRNLQEVTDAVEETGWGRVRWHGGATQVSVRAGASRRDPDDYDLGVAAALEQNPLLRKYSLAYRFRDFAEARVTYGWPGTGLSIGGEARYASDDYSRSDLGLRKADDRQFAADLTWSLSERVSWYVQGSYQSIDSRILGSETFDGPDWSSRHEDTFRTIGAGLDFGAPSDRFDLRLSVVQAKGHGDVVVDSTLSGAGPYPQLQTDLKSATIDLGYRLRDPIELRLRVRYEDFSTADWALAGVEPATIPTVLTLGAAPYDDNRYIAALSVRYFFGRKPPASAAAEK